MEPGPILVNSFLQSEAMAKIWSGKLSGFGGKSGSAKKSEAKGDAAPVVVEEAPKEVFGFVLNFFFQKTTWNLTLKSFDSSKKIAAIKEVKAIFGFGLKEVNFLVFESFRRKSWSRKRPRF
jgi:hypothetical protein